MLYSKNVISQSNKYIYNIQPKIENQLSKQIKILKSNRDREYESNKFNDLCANFDIIHQATTPYTPQQNEIVERKNETLKEIVNSMLISSESP